MLQGAFKDIKVLDISQGIAGPHCAWLLAQHGAEVVKVEPLEGDWIRGLGVRRNGTSAFAYSYNSGKRSLAVNLKSPEGVDLIQTLAGRSDVVLESYRPGVADRLGIGYERLRALAPALIYLSVSGYGLRGPWSAQPCTDTVAQAFSGLMGINLGTNGVPHKLDMTLIDVVTGLYAFQSISAALYARRDSGEGAHLDVSLMASAAAMQAAKIVEYQIVGGPSPVPNSPAGSYCATDGWMAITLVKEVHYQRLCEALERQDLLTDSRFLNFELRGENHQELADLVQSCISQRTRNEWMECFTRHEVLAQPINGYGDWLEHPQVTGAQTTARLPGTDGLQMPRVPGLDADFDAAPRIGEHSRSVLVGLGLASSEIDALVKRGIVADGAGTGEVR